MNDTIISISCRCRLDDKVGKCFVLFLRVTLRAVLFVLIVPYDMVEPYDSVDDSVDERFDELSRMVSRRSFWMAS